MYALKQFENNDIITVYCGLYKDTKKPSKYSMTYSDVDFDVQGDNGQVHLMWGAHFANDLNWRPQEGEYHSTKPVGKGGLVREGGIMLHFMD